MITVCPMDIGHRRAAEKMHLLIYHSIAEKSRRPVRSCKTTHLIHRNGRKTAKRLCFAAHGHGGDVGSGGGFRGCTSNRHTQANPPSYTKIVRNRSPVHTISPRHSKLRPSRGVTAGSVENGLTESKDESSRSRRGWQIVSDLLQSCAFGGQRSHPLSDHGPAESIRDKRRCRRGR